MKRFLFIYLSVTAHKMSSSPGLKSSAMYLYPEASVHSSVTIFPPPSERRKPVSSSRKAGLSSPYELHRTTRHKRRQPKDKAADR